LPIFRHPLEIENFSNYYHPIQKFFELKITLEFWNIEFEPTFPLISMSLHKGSTAMCMVLRQGVLGFIPIAIFIFLLRSV
jgi:hypothetical protein